MRMKWREAAKHERGNGIQVQSSAIHAAFRVADFHRVWLPEQAEADRTREIYNLVAFFVSADRRGNRLGDVPVLAVKELRIRG